MANQRSFAHDFINSFRGRQFIRWIARGACTKCGMKDYDPQPARLLKNGRFAKDYICNNCGKKRITLHAKNPDNKLRVLPNDPA